MSKFFEKYFKVKGEGLNDIVPVWKKIERIPEFAVLKTCKQSTKWHGEGDAFVHTQCVVNECLKAIPLQFWGLSDIAEALILAALFHDIGKGTTTFEKDGKWHAYGHEIESEKITRKLLWDEGYRFREMVCCLVRWHMEPLNWFNRKNNMLEEIVRVATILDSNDVTLTDLLHLKLWDVKGSKQEDENSKAKDIENLRYLLKLSQQMGLNTRNGASGYDYFMKERYKKEGEKKPLYLYMMIGLPGAGKDTYLNERLIQTDSPFTYINHKGVLKTIPTIDPAKAVVLCRDDIRVELGYCKEGEKIVGTSKQEDKVSEVFNDKLLEAAREGKTIVINNINLKSKYREQIVRYLSGYDLVVRYIYIEAKTLDLNRERRYGQIPDEAFDNMIMNFDWPSPFEYDEFYKIVNGE